MYIIEKINKCIIIQFCDLYIYVYDLCFEYEHF